RSWRSRSSAGIESGRRSTSRWPRKPSSGTGSSGCGSACREPPPEQPPEAEDAEGEGRRPGQRADQRRAEVGPTEQGVDEERPEGEVGKAVDPGPGPAIHPGPEPAGDGNQEQEVEGDRAEAEGEPAGPVVRGEEGHDEVERRHPGGGVEEQADQVEEPERDPEDGRELVGRPED